MKDYMNPLAIISHGSIVRIIRIIHQGNPDDLAANNGQDSSGQHKGELRSLSGKMAKGGLRTHFVL